MKTMSVFDRSCVDDWKNASMKTYRRKRIIVDRASVASLSYYSYMKNCKIQRCETLNKTVSKNGFLFRKLVGTEWYKLRVWWLFTIKSYASLARALFSARASFKKVLNF